MSDTPAGGTGLPAWREVASQTVWKGFVRLRRLTFETMVRGRPATVDREVHHHGHGCAVLAYDPAARTAVLVRQFRSGAHAAGRDPFLLEAVAGLVEAGEDPAETVRREAIEEAGLALDALEKVATAFSSPGTVTEEVHLFLARYDRATPRQGGGGVAGEHEEIEVVELPLARLFHLADCGALVDMKTLLLVETLRRRQPQLATIPWTEPVETDDLR